MKETIKSLEKQREEALSKLHKIENAINALQQVCSHKDEGGTDMLLLHTSGGPKDLYVCEICHYRNYV